MEHIKLLLDIGELNWVFKDSESLEDLLQNIVKMVARHMQADVCSIYFYDENSNELVMRANVGLARGSVGKIKMKLGEGIAGTSLEKMEPICTKDSVSHPNFKYFKGTKEELYKSFLAVPMSVGNSKVGVLVLQRKEENHFLEDDVLALRVIASQLANLMENVRLMTSVGKARKDDEAGPEKPVFTEKFVKGKPASRGYAYARVCVTGEHKRFNELERMKFRKYPPRAFASALKSTESQIENLQKQVERNIMDEASMIFTSHLLILKDKMFLESIIGAVKKGKNPPEAVLDGARKFINIFLASPNEYMKEKAKDVEDIAARIISNMVKNDARLPGVKGRIVITKDLYPSDVLKLYSEGVKGVVLTSGGVTSHVSILARSLGIPMVIINRPGLINIPQAAKVLVDAELGNIFIDPSKDILDEFKDKLDKVSGAPLVPMLPQTLTKDGIKIELMANVNLLKDLDVLKALSCDGIGLYRSEFPFLVRNSFPSEEEQLFVYRKLVEGVAGKEVTFRTLDVGGDKILPYSQSESRENTFLGLRSIRFSLKNRKIFKDQIRAILRAGHNANLRIMFPMIFSVEEFVSAKGLVREWAMELAAQKIEHNSSPQIGMMVEIPAVVDLIPEFARHADFFSIGTNDLVQYMLAVDRTNEEVADYYIPHHPSVLRAVKKVVDACLAANKDVSVCGDMSSSPQYIYFLIGCGIRKLSMNPGYLLENQKAIALMDSTVAKAAADKILLLSKIGAVEEVMFGKMLR